jgi:myo-inositol-1(or 4)-monophosphatase
VVAAVLGRIRDLRRGGTAALDLCHIAAGEVDAYWELDLSPWDYAAGTLIAREAGAAVEHVAAAHGRGPAVVAAHPDLMPAFFELLREAGALARE